MTEDDQQALSTTMPQLLLDAVAATRFWTSRANTLFALDARTSVPVPEVRFDLRGRTAGLVVYQRERREPGVIRLNRELLRSHPREMLEETVPHEVAHVVARWLHGGRIKPHGPEWRSIMHAFGKQATACHAMRTRPARRVRYYAYACVCAGPQYLSVIRHRRSQRGRQQYQCRRCGQRLRYTQAAPSLGHPDEQGE